MKQVTAIIHLAKRGRTTTARYGKFLRPDTAPHPCATDLHLWLGRELSTQEFNDELPNAIRSVLATDTVYAKIIEREVPGDEAEAGKEALEALQKAHDEALTALKGEHAEALQAVQQGVNEFTAEHNDNLRQARERIAELEAAAAKTAEEAAKPELVTEQADESAQETISKETAPPSEVGEPPVVEAAPPPAGEQAAAAAANPADKPKGKSKDKDKDKPKGK